MDDPGFWSRLKRARLIRALAVYLGTAWVFLQVVEVLQDGLSLPDWVVPVTLILLGAGFLIVGLTAWVQSHPGMEAREAADEVPGDWELALSEVKDSLFRGEIPHPNWARALVGGVFVFSLLFGAAGLYVVIQDRGESFQPAPIYAGEAAPAIAVLPFLVSGSELEEWEEGLADLLSTGLDGAAGLRAVDSRTVLSEWNRVVAEEDPDLATSLSVAEGTGARFALEGSVTSIGSSVRLVARVHDLETGARLGTAQVEGSLDSPHSLVDRLSLDILRILLGGDTEDLPRVDLAAVTTTSTEALKAYLQGERHYREGRFDAAIEAYRDAVRMDSTFALAHHRLSLALGWADTSNPLQERHRERALELADRLPERERLLVTGNLRMTRSPADSTELQTPLEEAVELYPNYAEAWYLLGETYFHEPDLIMPPSEIEEIFERAIELDPRVAAYRIHHVRFSIFLHADSALAARRVAEYREIADPDDLYLPRFEGDRAFAFGDSATRAMVLDTILLLPDPPIVPFVGMTGHPALLDAQEMFLRTGIRELFPSSRIAPDALRTLGRNLANQGRYAEALELLDHPSLAGTAHFACLVGELRMIGVPVGPEAVSRALVGTNDDDSE
ncbi:MAG: tetratricopeptide repeat protein, partial [Longimicrobiales bacterium]|nr:tetratricopeptide repeat protein [Longimicrobiales bacterium]